MTVISIATTILLAMTDQYGHAVIVRADLIATSQPSGSDTEIILVTGKKVVVRQSPEEIMRAVLSAGTNQKQQMEREK